MSFASSAARGAFTTLGGQWVRFVIQLLTIAVLARLLTPGDFGVVTMVMAVVGIASLLSDFGLSMASIQSKEITQAQRSNLFWCNCLAGALLTLTVFLLSTPLAMFYDRSELIQVCQALSVIFFLNAAIAQFKAEISRKLRFKWLAITDVTAQVAASTTAIVLAVLGWSYHALVAQQIVVSLISAIMLIAGSKWRPGLPTRNSDMKSLFQFGANTMGVQLVNYASSNADSLLVGKVWGAAALGSYDRAYQIFRIPMQQIAAPMTRVAFPILSRVQVGPEFDRYVQRAQLLLAYGMGGLFFLAAAMSDPLIEIALGEGWDASKSIFRVLALGGVFQSMGFVYHWVFLARALTGMQLRYSLAGRGLMVAMMAVGVFYGPLGVAVGGAGGLALNWLIMTLFAAPKADIDTRALVKQACWPLLMGAGLVSVSIPVSVWSANLGALAQLLILSTVLGAYVCLVVLLVPPIRRDARLIWRTVQLVRGR